MPLPKRLTGRLRSWERTHRLYFILHYLIGIIGVVASSLASTKLLGNPEILSIVASVCIAILAFVRPEREHIRFWQAWKTLDRATVRYECGLASLEEVLDALDHGESGLLAFDVNQKI